MPRLEKIMKFDTKVVLGKELLGFVKLERSDFPERNKQLFLRSLKDTANWLGGGNDILKAPYIDPHYFPKLEFFSETYLSTVLKSQKKSHFYHSRLLPKTNI